MEKRMKFKSILLLLLVIFFTIGCLEDESTPDIELITTYGDKIPSGVYNLYPKLDISQLEYEITNNGFDVLEVTLSSEISGYTDMTINTEQIEPNEVKIINQTPIFKPGILETLTETKTANLHYKLTYREYDGERVLDEQTIPIELYAKDTMLWGVIEDGEYIDLSPLIVAWVTPHVAEVDEVVRIAAEYNSQRSMGAATTPEERFEQIEAIYNALKYEYDITYISSSISYSGNTESTQRVKRPSESIKLASANCIDGTVLFASALENIEINPYIVIVPGHAFLAWGDGKGNIEGALETTMVGNSEFYDAYDYGTDKYNELVGNDDAILISIKDAREIGITPMK